MMQKMLNQYCNVGRLSGTKGCCVNTTNIFKLEIVILIGQECKFLSLIKTELYNTVVFAGRLKKRKFNAEDFWAEYGSGDKAFANLTAIREIFDLGRVKNNIFLRIVCFC